MKVDFRSCHFFAGVKGSAFVLAAIHMCYEKTASNWINIDISFPASQFKVYKNREKLMLYFF
jgi:hypothetical protein